MRRPSPRALAREAVAGLPGAIGSVPDGMAASVLVGVNPIHGLYASIVGPVVGGLSASTRRMLVTTTSAASLAAASAVSGVAVGDRAPALFVLVVLAGLLMVLASVLHLGRYTRFVSQSVMQGFLAGVAVNIIASQVPDVLGVSASGDFSLAKAIDALRRLGEAQGGALACAAITAVAAVGLGRTRLDRVAALISIVVPTVVVTVLSLRATVVADLGAIPTGIPLPHLPSLSLLSPDLVFGAIAVTAIVLIQGVGVAESVPKDPGEVTDVSRDFLAQGAANIASGVFRGLPVGGSVGQSALNIASGARSRWAGVFSGLWLLAIVVALGGLVGRVPVAALAALLIVAGVRAIRVGELRAVWSVGSRSRVALVVTFVAALVLPIAAAVAVGVIVSLMLQLGREATDLRVVQLEPQPDGALTVAEAPAALRSNAVTVLDTYGSLLYAGARTLEARLPDPTGAHRPVVVLRLRGRSAPTATFAAVLKAYAQRLDVVGGHLIVSGIEPDLAARYRLVLDGTGIETVTADEVLGRSTLDAVRRGEEWLQSQPPPPTVDPAP